MRFDGRSGLDVSLMRTLSVRDVLHVQDQASILTHVAAFCCSFDSEDDLTKCSTLKDIFISGKLLSDDEDCTSRSVKGIMAHYMDRVITQLPLSVTRLDAVVGMVYNALQDAIVKGNWPDADAIRFGPRLSTHKSTCLRGIGTQPLYACKQTTDDFVKETSHHVHHGSYLTKDEKSCDEMFFTSQSWEYDAMQAVAVAESKAAEALADEMQRCNEERTRHAIASMKQKCQDCGRDINLGDHITHRDAGWCHSSCGVSHK